MDKTQERAMHVKSADQSKSSRERDENAAAGGLGRVEGPGIVTLSRLRLPVRYPRRPPTRGCRRRWHPVPDQRRPEPPPPRAS